jgi:hypothetical protein
MMAQAGEQHECLAARGRGALPYHLGAHPHHREAQEGQRQGHDQNVGVQIGKQETPQREFVDGVADDA